MAPLVNSLLVLSILGGAFAAPAARPLQTRGRHSVKAVHQPHARNGTAAMLKAYAKFGLTATSSDSILNKRQDGSVGATPASSNSEYICPVTIGGQTLNLDFDSGSSDLWVFSSSLSSSDQSGHTVFDPSQSSTFQETSGSTWSISYADGSSASGTVGTDTVTIGETVVTGQSVELATQVSSSFQQGGNDGLVGFAFDSINTVQPSPVETFFDNAQSGLDAPIFCAYLPYQADGEYDFGATDSSKFTGDIVYTNVDSSNGFWEFGSTSYKVGDQTFDASGTTGIADTGTTLILMSDAAVSNYYAQVDGSQNDSSQGGYTFPCTATLPDLSFLIGPDNYATVPAKFMNFAPTDSSGSTCFGALQSVGSGTQNIYGDSFFNANYGVFDASVPQFGFATST